MHNNRKIKNRAQLLTAVLLDKTAREDERGDAAIDLRAYPDLRVLEALTLIASDANEDDVIADNCAESIGEICVALNLFPEHYLRKITPFAQKIVFGFILGHKPELIPQPLRNARN